ncbi:MAG: hypothetical protein ACFFDN_02005 [Candidatus Hodarchaeota archaeon]
MSFGFSSTIINPFLWTNHVLPNWTNPIVFLNIGRINHPNEYVIWCPYTIGDTFIIVLYTFWLTIYRS